MHPLLTACVIQSQTVGSMCEWWSINAESSYPAVGCSDWCSSRKCMSVESVSWSRLEPVTSRMLITRHNLACKRSTWLNTIFRRCVTWKYQFLTSYTVLSVKINTTEERYVYAQRDLKTRSEFITDFIRRNITYASVASLLNKVNKN